MTLIFQVFLICCVHRLLLPQHESCFLTTQGCAMPPSNMECFICCSHCVPKCQFCLLLHTNPLDFLCLPLCIFLTERCRMYWKLFYERSFLDLLLFCCPVTWSIQLETLLCFPVLILLIYEWFLWLLLSLSRCGGQPLTRPPVRLTWWKQWVQLSPHLTFSFSVLFYWKLSSYFLMLRFIFAFSY